MNVEDVYERARIEFPKGLTLTQSEEMLKYLARKLPANVNYLVSHHKSFRHEEGQLISDNGSFNLQGQINLIGSDLVFDSFTIKNSGSHLEFYEAGELKFQLVQGGNINEYREEVRQLWDDTRTTVEKYFESRFN